MPREASASETKPDREVSSRLESGAIERLIPRPHSSSPRQIAMLFCYLGHFAWAPLMIAVAAHAASATEPPPPEQVTIIATTPLPGTGIDVDKLPSNIQTISAIDLTRDGAASVTTALNSQLGSVSINDDLDDPFQPDILFRGFKASPALGTPEGLAVYQNGVRINEAFGDTLNWDLFPDVAIDRVDIVGSNPVYGLNALGGAVVVNMKNGFTYHGAEAELSGGSWGQRQGSIQYGANNGTFGAYIAGRLLEENGWRENSSDTLNQLYADFSYRSDAVTLDLSFTGAYNRLDGQGASPVQELAVDRSLIFTSPQNNTNRLAFVTLGGSYIASDTLSIQGNFYYREFRQSVVNGNTTNSTACTVSRYLGFLCQPDGTTPLITSAGALLPDISEGGSIPIGENDFESTHSVGVGGSIQATEVAALFAHENQLSFGATIDNDSTNFQSSTEPGTISPSLVVSSGGLLVNTPEDTPWNATPVGLGATNRYFSLFATDTFNITPDLAATASGRYNLALIDLIDRRGSDLSGQNRYSRLNLAVGLTEKLTTDLTAYGSYSEGSRAPSPSEIECANPVRPCLLPSSLASDPPTLRQVVSHTWEAGLRGNFAVPALGNDKISWNAGLFRTEVDNDIYGVATSLSTGFFQNIGGTMRQGAELGLHYRRERLSAFLNYSYVDARFQSALLLHSPQNPFADANGDIQVRPGDLLPGIPTHRIKAGADYRLTSHWLVGGALTYESAQYFRGDESNQLKPLPGFAMLNLHSSYEVIEGFELFVHLENALNARYSTFGVLGDPTGIGAPGIPTGAGSNGQAVDNRFESPAPPISVFGGVRVTF
jgi:iron complex outermembrane recepter protein